MRGRRRLIVEQRVHQTGAVLVVEGGPAGDELVCDRAQRVAVRRRRGRLAAQPLWREVLEGGVRARRKGRAEGRLGDPKSERKT